MWFKTIKSKPLRVVGFDRTRKKENQNPFEGCGIGRTKEENKERFRVPRDDSLLACIPNVHDVKLGDTTEDSPAGPTTSDSRTNPARGSDSAEVRGPNSFASRGSMSFAAAAMAGLSSANTQVPQAPLMQYGSATLPVYGAPTVFPGHACHASQATTLPQAFHTVTPHNQR
ncbi:hypothetical protein Tco_0407497 [Tanacetum coccineum]